MTMNEKFDNLTNFQNVFFSDWGKLGYRFHKGGGGVERHWQSGM